MHFRIPGVTKREKTIFQKKLKYFDKLIIKNVHNELIYIKRFRIVFLKILTILRSTYFSGSKNIPV